MIISHSFDLSKSRDVTERGSEPKITAAHEKKESKGEALKRILTAKIGVKA